jgi:hypothetical protein
LEGDKAFDPVSRLVTYLKVTDLRIGLRQFVLS